MIRAAARALVLTTLAVVLVALPLLGSLWTGGRGA